MLVVVLALAAQGSEWTRVTDAGLAATNPTGGQTTKFCQVVVNGNGNIQVVSTHSGGMYRSDDTGKTWSPVQDDDFAGNEDWRPVAMTAEGSLQLAASSSGSSGNVDFYRSTDAGKSWSVVDDNVFTGVTAFESVAMNKAGTNQLVATAGEGMFRSTNSGNSWAVVTDDDFPVSAEWRSVAMSGNGNVQLAATMGKGMFKSINAGLTWDPVTSDEFDNQEDWAVAMNDAGTVQLAIDLRTNAGDGMETKMVRSDDAGVSWTVVNSPDFDGTKTWQAVAMNGDGTIQHAVYINSGLYESTDSGKTWKRAYQEIFDGTHKFTSVALNTAGNVRLLAHQNTASNPLFRFESPLPTPKPTPAPTPPPPPPPPPPGPWMSTAAQTATGVALGTVMAVVPIAAATRNE